MDIAFIDAAGNPATPDIGIKNRILASTPMPGDFVRPAGNDASADLLEVERTVVTVGEAGFEVSLGIKGVDGLSELAGFESPGVVYDGFGTLITLDDELWYVPMLANSETAVVPEGMAPVRIEGIGRLALFQLTGTLALQLQSNSHEFSMVKGVFREPAVGDLMFEDRAGVVQLFAASWTADCSGPQIDLAHSAIAAANGAPAPSGP